jgi:aminoglycoside phosphotransferase (APT) family kinase protein
MNYTNFPEKVFRTLAALKVHNPVLLGKGGEGHVFEYGQDSALKIYTGKFVEASESYLQSLRVLQDLIATHNLPFDTPRISEIGQIDGTYFTIEKLLHGTLMEHKFPTLEPKQQYKLLESYYRAMRSLGAIELPNRPFGNVLDIETAVRDASWPSFLKKMLDNKTSAMRPQLQRDVLELDRKLAKLKLAINKHFSTKIKQSLVHADYFVNQVLVGDDNEVSAVLDISYHALAGDNRLDVAGFFFFEGMPHYTGGHISFLRKLAADEFGPSLNEISDIYRLYYCFYFSDAYHFSPQWYVTLLRNLNDSELWARLNEDA